ncbi:MAG: ankyrin repeat domain-containing protein [Pseudomonadales bacterium]|nr:ankyrin repeat domain-containing protein [Pseudomonadales bacterium]
MPPITSESILEAAVIGDAETVRYLLDQDPNLVNARDVRGLTPLHLSSRPGLDGSYRLAMPYDGVVRIMIERKADVNAKSKNGITPMHIACTYKVPKSQWSVTMKINNKPVSYPQFLREMQMRSLKYFINGGADVNAKAPNGYTPLLSAVSYNHLDMALVLIEKGANLDAKADDGSTVCGIATERGYKQIIEICK